MTVAVYIMIVIDCYKLSTFSSLSGEGPLPAAARRGGGEGHHDSLRLLPPPLTPIHVFSLLFFSQHNVHVQILENKECNVYVFKNIWTSLS